ncbi:MAG: VCBS repeat-containing protein, partial [Gammaproteobacteria bacterium]|nr:VCBS repeat-containing protein [Gammaproteobacteria bacterium]
TALTLTGNLTDLNNYLNTDSNITYLHGTANTNGNDADTIQINVNDNGNTGTGGGTDIDLGTVNVDITQSNDAPSFGDKNSPTNFYDHTIATGSDFRNTQSQIFSIDLDGDGYMDVLANTWSSGELVWFENNDNKGDFIEHNIYMPDATGRFTDIYSADINNDTYLDLVVATDTQLIWLKNNGSQSFSWQLIDSLGDGLSSVSVTDFDDDNHMEIVSASSNDDTIAWYKNNGNEVFTRNVLTSTAEGAATVVTAYVDSDNEMDIV